MNLAGIIFFLSGCGVASVALAGTPAMPVSLIPMPAHIVYAQGGFDVDAGTLIVSAPDDAAAQKTAAYLAALIDRTRALPLKTGVQSKLTNAIVLQRDPQAAVTNAEGYTLDVTPQGIRIAARTDAGLFYGAMTLAQLLTPDGKRGAVQVPSMHIEDQPRFSWRGLMLDSARHMQSVREIETLLDQMAQHKLNTFHWHLTDDQGWRIQIMRYPQLTQVGAWRTPIDAGLDGQPLRYGGFYTQEQIRQLVAFAADRHITVVPEIDMPGHAQAAVASYPSLGVTGKRPPVSVDWGVHPYLYNVDDATFAFIDNVLDEVLALFPSHYIHVGGDEAVKDQWMASPAVQAKMRALGLKDEDALQGWFINRLGDHLAAHGRQLIGWDEILQGALPPGSAVMSWRGTQGEIDAARLGHDVVLSTSPDLYFDQLQSNRADETAGRIPVRSLASIYAFNPLPAALGPNQATHVLGVQANVWTEHMPTMQHVEHAVFPRIDALSEVGWSPESAHDWRAFVARLPAQFARYRAQNIGYADSAFAPDITVNLDRALATGTTQLTLTNQANAGAIHYTLDGSLPTILSALYQAPVSVSLPLTVRAATFSADGLVLAAPRDRLLDRARLLSFSGNVLANCPGSDFRLRVQPLPDAQSLAPVYSINVFDSCQQLPATPLDGVTHIHVDAVRLPRNYQLAHDAKLVVSRPHSTPFGELVVHLDRCDGKTLATLPLPDPAHSARTFSLEASLDAARGAHTLCLIYTAPINGPLYALDRVTLLRKSSGEAAH